MTENVIKKEFIVIAIILILSHMGIAIVNGGFSGVLKDTDAYMWLNRVTYLHENGTWFEHNYPRINPPFGHTQHWTRPFDFLLLAGASVLSPFFGFEKALLSCSAFISPILSIAALFSFFWALYPLFRLKDTPKEMMSISGFLFISQAAIFTSFMFGRSDHQSLIFLLLILTIGFTIRLLLMPYTPLLSLNAGFVSGIALWVSMETSLIIAIVTISLSIYWILGNNEYLKKLLTYSISIFVTVIIALLIEKGFHSFTEVYYDQISIVYILAVGLNFISWSIIFIWQNFTNIPSSKLYRFSLLALMGLLCGIIIYIFFPEFFLGPLHEVDALYRRNRLAHINELQPIFSLSGLFSNSWLKELSRFLVWIGIIIPALPTLLLFLLRRENPNKPFWVFISLGTLVFCPLAISQIRWAPYLVIFILPAYAWLIALLIDTIQRKGSGRLYSCLRLTVLGVFLFWFYIPTSILSAIEQKDTILFTDSTLKSMCDYLNNPNGWGGQPKNVLANPDFGPEILYRTKHNVFSIPNHRNQKGFADTYHIFSAIDSYSAFEVIEERDIDLILICLTYPERVFYENENSEAHFYDQLRKRMLPDWLRTINLPSELSKNFLLFEVVH